MADFRRIRVSFAPCTRVAAVCFLCILPVESYAKSAPSLLQPEIREHQSSSVDIFDVLTRIPKAKQAYEDGDFSQALQDYRYVYLHDPDQKQALMGYADAALALGQCSLATSLYAKFEDEHTRASSGALICQILSQQSPNPEMRLLAQIKHAPDDARLYNLLGKILDHSARGKEARIAYGQAKTLEQRAGLADNNIGQSYLVQGDLDAALDAFTRAVTLAPKTELFDSNRRLVLLLKRDYSAALTRIDSARASTLLKDAARITERQGEIKLAEYMMRKAVSLDPVYDPRSTLYLAALTARLAQ